MRPSSRIPRHALAALIALAALAVLWQLRPGLPALPESPTAAVDGYEAEELLFAVLWLILAIVLVLIARALLDDIAHAIKQRRHSQIDALTERVNRPQRSTPARASTYPLYADHYAFTLDPSANPPPDYAPIEPAASIEDAGGPAGENTPAKPTATPGLSIALLGPLTIRGRSPIKRAATREMLAYLALHPSGATRDELIEALWPGQDPKHTLPRLYQSASDARRAFGDAIIRDHERYRLDRATISIDLDKLDKLLATTADPASELQALETALSLWRGQPFAGNDYLWAEGFVHQLHAALLDLLGRVAAARLQTGDARGALQAAERAITLDNLHEPSWRLALQADHALGLYTAVTKRYEALAHLLDEQLGLQPSQDTRMIYRQLLGQT